MDRDETSSPPPGPWERLGMILLVATPFLLLALFLFLEWWLRA